MEQNEQIEDNVFEKFEDQDKYSSIGKKIEEQADKYAKVSLRILTMEVIAICLGIVMPGMLVEQPYKNIFIRTTINLVFLEHMFSLGYAIAGYKIKKTNKTKELVFMHKIIPIVTMIVALAFLGMVYLLWATIISVSEEPVSFFKWVFDWIYSIVKI